MKSLYVEKKAGLDVEAKALEAQIKDYLGVAGLESLRLFNHYTVEGVSEAQFSLARKAIFSQPQTDSCFENLPSDLLADTIIEWELLPGQFDQRSDSAKQCLAVLAADAKDIVIHSSRVAVLRGAINEEDKSRVKTFLINTVDSRESPKVYDANDIETPAPIKTIEGFIKMSDEELETLRRELCLAMDALDVKYMRDYFLSEGRDPFVSEVRVLDTYWSDHCRHTTFLTELENVSFGSDGLSQEVAKAFEEYKELRQEVYGSRVSERKITLMDIATIGAKVLKKRGLLQDEEVSEENNACSVVIDVDGVKWLLMFKNETHNHPTEIEPFGGAATCIGGAIRDPLSGRAYVYQAMRVTGAADPRVASSKTMAGKLPQVKICNGAAHGFSSYGNQIGLATGEVTEYYHNNFVAKRLECGAVIAAVKEEDVLRLTPEPGDIIVMVGGGTGRDGIGGATGSSVEHTKSSVTKMGSEVQKGCAIEERKLQRLFRNKAVSSLIKRANDFGAGGVSVAIGELADGLVVDLDKVPKKYEGLDGTELAISESQERMAVVVAPKDAELFIKEAEKENLTAVKVATVTSDNRLVMKWQGKVIVDLSRKFLNSAGAPHKASAEYCVDFGNKSCTNGSEGFDDESASCEDKKIAFSSDGANSNNKGATFSDKTKKTEDKGFGKACSGKQLVERMAELDAASLKALGQRFDSTIGAGSVLFPFGGRTARTKECGMAALIPVPTNKNTYTASVMSEGFALDEMQKSSYHGAILSVLSSLAKVAAMGASIEKAHLSFQEFFGHARSKSTWGKPLGALLGALKAQIELGVAAIGGKDSMSGTYIGDFGNGERVELDVPNTLISFAVSVEDARNITSAAFKGAAHDVYLLDLAGEKSKRNAEGFTSEVFATFKKNALALYNFNKTHAICAMNVLGSGGVGVTVAQMSLGNEVGFDDEGKIGSGEKFASDYTSIVIEVEGGVESSDVLSRFSPGSIKLIGKTNCSGVVKLGGEEALISALIQSNEGVLAQVYPLVAQDAQKIPDFAKKVWNKGEVKFSVAKNAKPLVVIPVFPGTNCEFDMERAFLNAGAQVQQVVITNKTTEDLGRSLADFARLIDEAQILALAGGFSAADEPDGSAKFIANCLRRAQVSLSVTKLLERKGLVLGICNGFQALVKTGLATSGTFVDEDEQSPVLTFNTIGRHISAIARTKVVSNLSPWAQDESVFNEKIHRLAISHGEGRFVTSLGNAQKLFENGQVFSQYVDDSGSVAFVSPANPNGSVCAIEGVTSPDGLVLGKMAHNERSVVSPVIFKNIGLGDNESIKEDIFLAGVKWFS